MVPDVVFNLYSWPYVGSEGGGSSRDFCGLFAVVDMSYQAGGYSSHGSQLGKAVLTVHFGSTRRPSRARKASQKG